MRTVKVSLLILCVSLLVPAAVTADTPRVALYTGPGADNCNLYDTGTALHEVYVVYTGPTEIVGIEFKLEQTYDAGLTYLGSTIIQPRTLTAGSADTGIGIAMGECLDASGGLQVLKVWYQGLGVSAQCSKLKIIRNPQSTHVNGSKIFCVGCFDNSWWADPVYLTINPNEGCECESPGSGGSSPVAVTTWGGIKAMYTD